MKAIAGTLLIVGLAASLAGCGRKNDLIRPADLAPPAIPRGAVAPPTPNEQLTVSTQAQPGRSNEILTTSQVREPDPFDLPPTH